MVDKYLKQLKIEQQVIEWQRSVCMVSIFLAVPRMTGNVSCIEIHYRFTRKPILSISSEYFSIQQQKKFMTTRNIDNKQRSLACMIKKCFQKISIPSVNLSKYEKIKIKLIQAFNKLSRGKQTKQNIQVLLMYCNSKQFLKIVKKLKVIMQMKFTDEDLQYAQRQIRSNVITIYKNNGQKYWENYPTVEKKKKKIYVDTIIIEKNLMWQLSNKQKKKRLPLKKWLYKLDPQTTLQQHSLENSLVLSESIQSPIVEGTKNAEVLGELNEKPELIDSGQNQMLQNQQSISQLSYNGQNLSQYSWFLPTSRHITP